MSLDRERNRQLVRQWRILRALEETRATIGELARDLNVASRTIRRDLAALEAAGFPLYDIVDELGARRWHLLAKGVTPARRAA